MSSHNFPRGHRRNESTGVTPEARKYTVAHGENIAFGDALAPVLPYLTPEKPRTMGKPSETSFLPHLVPEEHLMETD